MVSKICGMKLAQIVIGLMLLLKQIISMMIDFSSVAFHSSGVPAVTQWLFPPQIQ